MYTDVEHARDRKNLSKSINRNHILFNDLQLSECSKMSSFLENRVVFRKYNIQFPKSIIKKLQLK